MVVLVVAYMRSVHDGDEPIVDGDNCVSGPLNRDRVRVLLHYAIMPPPLPLGCFWYEFQ